MKATQDITIYLDKKGNRVQHYSADSLDGKTKKVFKKGDVLPDDLVYDFLRTNVDYLDVTYQNGNVVLTEDEKIKFGFKPKIISPEIPKEPVKKIEPKKGKK